MQSHYQRFLIAFWNLSLELEKFFAFTFLARYSTFFTLINCIKKISLQVLLRYMLKLYVINQSHIYSEKIYNSSLFGLTLLPLRSNPFNSLIACLAIYLIKSSSSLPPSYLTGLFLEFLGAQ